MFWDAFLKQYTRQSILVHHMKEFRLMNEMENFEEPPVCERLV